MRIALHHVFRGRSKLCYAIIAAVGCTVFLVTAYRSFTKHPEQLAKLREIEKRRDTAIAVGQREFRKLQMVDTASFSSVTELTAHLTNVDSQDRSVEDSPENEANRRQLVSDTAEFIFYRFVQDSPSVYRQWRESKGYRLKDGETMRRGVLEDEYEYYFDEPYPGDEHLEQVFDRLWTFSLDMRDGASRALRMAADGGGVEVCFGAVDDTWMEPFPTLSGELAASVWHGEQQVQLGRNWWRDPRDGIHKEVSRRPSVPIAIVGVIMEMKAGDRYPVTFTFYQDAAGAWWLWRINAMNVAAERLAQLEF